MAQGSTQSSDLRSPGSDTPVPASGWVLAGDRPAEIARFEEGVVAFFVDAAELLGIPKSVAAIYGLVFASPVPLSFSEIVERLDFSSGSVSQGLKTLREIGAVRLVEPAENGTSEGRAGKHRAAGEGRSRDRFEPDIEMRRLIQRFIEQRLETQLSRGKTRLSSLQAMASIYKDQDRKVMDSRLFKLRRWHNRTRAMIPLIKTFLKLTKV